MNSEYEEWTSEGIFVSLSDGFTILIECESIWPDILQIYAIYCIEAVNCFRFTERNFWPGNLKIEWPAASPPTGGWWHHTSHNTQCVMYSFYCVFETLSTNETVSNHFGEVKVKIKGVIELFLFSTGWYNWYWVYKLLLGFWVQEREPPTETEISILQCAFEMWLTECGKRQEWSYLQMLLNDSMHNNNEFLIQIASNAEFEVDLVIWGVVA